MQSHNTASLDDIVNKIESTKKSLSDLKSRYASVYKTPYSYYTQAISELCDFQNAQTIMPDLNDFLINLKKEKTELLDKRSQIVLDIEKFVSNKDSKIQAREKVLKERIRTQNKSIFTPSEFDGYNSEEEQKTYHSLQTQSTGTAKRIYELNELINKAEQAAMVQSILELESLLEELKIKRDTLQRDQMSALLNTYKLEMAQNTNAAVSPEQNKVTTPVTTSSSSVTLIPLTTIPSWGMALQPTVTTESTTPKSLTPPKTPMTPLPIPKISRDPSSTIPLFKADLTSTEKVNTPTSTPTLLRALSTTASVTQKGKSTLVFNLNKNKNDSSLDSESEDDELLFPSLGSTQPKIPKKRLITTTPTDKSKSTNSNVKSKKPKLDEKEKSSTNHLTVNTERKEESDSDSDSDMDISTPLSRVNRFEPIALIENILARINQFAAMDTDKRKEVAPMLEADITYAISESLNRSKSVKSKINACSLLFKLISKPAYTYNYLARLEDQIAQHQRELGPEDVVSVKLLAAYSNAKTIAHASPISKNPNAIHSSFATLPVTPQPTATLTPKKNSP